MAVVRGNERQLHGRECAVGDQVGGEREEPGRQGHRPGTVSSGGSTAAVSAAATSQIQSEPRRKMGKSCRWWPIGSSIHVATAQMVEQPEHRKLLELPERQR